MIRTIVQNGEKVLRDIAREIPVAEIATPKIQKIIKDMKASLDSQSDGVAIAAPQIGESVRIFVVSGKIFDEDFKDGKKMIEKKTKENPDMIFVNPVIEKLSKRKKWMAEGCLSVRWLYGEVERSTNATVSAYDEHGKKFKKGAGGLLAHIFQHETDHLNGTLFIDKARNIEEGRPEEHSK